jgi:DNA repair exonuclease SbcCD ATPase subunit
MLALYEANTKHIGAAGSIHSTIKSLTDAHAKSQLRVNDLKAQIERLNVVAQQMPERKHLDELTAQVALLDQAYTDARRKAKDINDDLERMRQALPANPQPAGTAQAPVVDPELSKMQEELDATNKRLAETKAERAKASEAAQAALDAALGQFEKEIAGAQGIAKDNPELSAYVSAAQKLQTSTRELTEQLIRRQQQQQQQLGELKTRLSEKMEARRADAWKKDPKLQEYGDQLEIVKRQYNAAVGGGAKKEAEDFKAQADMLDKMIKARQTLVGDDAFYADAIDQLQKMIDSSQRSLDDDRKHTEAVLEEMQAAFTKSQPAVEKMPAAQKELAASLEKQLAGVNAARKQYTEAADAAAAAGDEEVKMAQAAAATLAAKIETRRKELASQAEKAATAEQEQNRIAAVKERETQLVAAQAVELKARQEWDTAQRALREVESAQAEAREAGEKRDALAAERVTAQKELEAVLRQLELKRAEAGHSVEPFPPTEADVQMTVHDPRPVYALASVGGIVAVFTLLILFTAGGPAAEPDEIELPAEFPAFAARTPPTPIPNGNGNGSPAVQPAPAEEESPRVAV